MLTLMEGKKSWNLSCFSSVAEEFDKLIDKNHRGDKGVTVSAALAMFVASSPERRQRFVDIVKLAEGRGFQGTVYQAAKKLIEEDEQAEALAKKFEAEADKALQSVPKDDQQPKLERTKRPPKAG